MNMIIYRGTHEIGGTFIELKTDNSRILLDAGYPLFLNGLPIDDKVSSLSADELAELGVIPQIKGLYQWDNPDFDAVILSHAHIDHYGLLPYIHPDIKVYLSAGTKKLIEISQLFGICKKYSINSQVFTMYDHFSAGDFTIKPYLMDHSAFDAAAFEISCSGKTIIYTGDFRGHGRKAICLERFIEQVKKNADILLTEGSMLGRLDEEVLTEEELEIKAAEIIRSSTGITLFQSSSQNIDRIVSFYKSAMAANKIFVIDVYTANVLYELRMLGNHLPYPSDEYRGIRVFYPYRLTEKIFKSIGGEYAKRFSAYYMPKEQLSNNQSQIVMMVRPSMLADIKRCNLSGGNFIYSMWQGYRDTNYQKRMETYLQEQKFNLQQLHTSGHACLVDIKKIIEKLDPKVIIPIHTMFPEEFLNFSERVQLMQDGIEMLV